MTFTALSSVSSSQSQFLPSLTTVLHFMHIRLLQEACPQVDVPATKKTLNLGLDLIIAWTKGDTMSAILEHHLL